MKTFSLAWLVLLLGCGHSQQNDSKSKWAHSSANRAMSVITARLNYLELGYKTDFYPLRVCIQNTRNFQGNDLLLDTKLAYAAWLDASGLGSENAWKQFRFVQRDHCTMTDSAFSSVIVIGSEEKITADQDVGKTFDRARAYCARQGSDVNCSTDTMTLGLGGPGTIGWTYFRSDKWESVSNLLPASAILSPYVQWLSLRGAIDSMKDGPLRSELAAGYRALAQGVESASYKDLSNFHKRLQAARIKGKANLDIERATEEFMNSGAANRSKVYVPRLVAFHVLLHEVGHQFGMDHADDPAADSESGFVENAENANGHWVTKSATMAYADNYYYLTDDDSAGVKDLAGKVLRFLKAKNGG